MADRMSAWIEIGGPIPASLVKELCQTIIDEGVSVGDWDCDPFDATTAAELLELCQLEPSQDDGQANPGTLKLFDHEVAYGRFDGIEDFCQQHGIAFDRHSDGKYEFDPEVVQFRPGRWPNTFVAQADHSGNETVRADEVREAIALGDKPGLKPAQRLRAVLEKLNSIVGPQVPNLEPLTIVAATEVPAQA